MDNRPPAPKISFPCEYSLRVICTNTPTIQRDVLTLIEPFISPVNPGAVRVKHSKKSRFISVYIPIFATGETQLSRIHRALTEDERVKMVI